MTAASDITVVAAFAGGLLAFFTPCVLPLVPGVLAGSVGGRARPALIVLGLALFLMLLGALSGALGVFLLNNDVLRVAAGLLLVALGLWWVAGRQVRDSPVNRLLEWLSRHRVSNRVLGPVLLGGVLALGGLACTGPILGPIFGLIATRADPAYGAFLLFWFALGLGVPMLAIAYLLKFSTARLRSIGRWEGAVRRVAGAVMVALGAVLIFGLDRALVAALL